MSNFLSTRLAISFIFFIMAVGGIFSANYSYRAIKVRQEVVSVKNVIELLKSENQKFLDSLTLATQKKYNQSYARQAEMYCNICKGLIQNLLKGGYVKTKEGFVYLPSATEPTFQKAIDKLQAIWQQLHETSDNLLKLKLIKTEGELEKLKILSKELSLKANDAMNIHGQLMVEKENRLARSTFLSILVNLVILLGSYLFLYRKVARPIVELKLAAQQLGEGNLDIPVSVPASISAYDELGLLAQAFDKMRVKLKAYVTELGVRARALSAILYTFDLDERLRLILDEAMALLGVEQGGIFFMEAGRLVCRIYKGLSEEFLTFFENLYIEKAINWLSQLRVIYGTQTEQTEISDAINREGLQVFVCIPLMLSNREWLGVMILGSRRYEVLTDKVQTLEHIARYLAIGIHYSRLHRQAQEHLYRLSVLRNIDKAITQHLSLKQVMRAVLELVPKELGVDSIAIGLMNETQSSFTDFAMRLPNGKVIYEPLFTFNDDLWNWFINKREPVVSDHIGSNIQMDLARLGAIRFVSYLGVPLIVRDRTVGILNIFTASQKLFSTEDIEFFQTLAGQVAVAIENARLFEETKERAERLELMLKTQREIAAAEPKRIGETVLKALSACVDIDRADYYAFEAKREVLLLQSSIQPSTDPVPVSEVSMDTKIVVSMDEGIVGKASKQRTAIYLADIEKDPICLGSLSNHIGANSMRSAYIVPLVFGEHLLGTIILFRKQVNGFDSFQRSLVDAFVIHASAAMEVARHFNQAQNRANQLEALTQIAYAVNQKLDFRSIAQIAVERSIQVLPHTALLVFSYDEDRESFRLESYNRLAEQIAGIYGLKLGDFTPRQKFTKFEELMKGTIVSLTETPIESFSTVLVPVISGEQILGVLYASRPKFIPFTDEDKEFLSTLGEHFGVAFHNAKLFEQLQKAYEELKQTQAILVRRERMQALGQMASGIAHDINNALVPVVAFIETIETFPDPQLQRLAKNIHQSINDIIHTIRRLQFFYRQPTPPEELKAVDLNEVVRQVVELTHPLWYDMPQKEGNTIQIVMDLDPSPLPAAGIGTEIREALINLILNAVDAIVAKDEKQGIITLRTGKQNSQVFMEVSDTGIGMDETTRQHCLEPFFTTKIKQGSGLGLAIVYGIIQRHKGSIEIESELGKGTTFRLLFPIQPEKEKEEKFEPEIPIPPLKILLIDDDSLVLTTISGMLRRLGHTVTALNDGKEGLNKFQEVMSDGEMFELVITDLGMPNVSGKEVVQAIKAQSPDTPVIVMTGWGSESTPAIADASLSKPVQTKALKKAIEKAISKHKAPEKNS